VGGGTEGQGRSVGDTVVAVEAIRRARLDAQMRRQALLLLIVLFTASWLCILEDGGSRAHDRAHAAHGHAAGHR